MARKIGLGLAIAAVLSMLAAPVAGADIYRVRATGEAVLASFSNLPDGEWEAIPPGEYFYTELIAASQLAVGSEEYEDSFFCVAHESFSVDETGEFNWLGGIFACGSVTSLAIDRRLQTGSVVASVDVEDCAAWDEETGECLEVIELGTIEIDLTLEGVGQIRRQRSASTGGIVGVYNYASHGTGAERDAIPSGTVTLDGESLIDGATTVDGLLATATGGWLEVSFGG